MESCLQLKKKIRLWESIFVPIDQKASAKPTELPDPKVIKLFSCSTQLSMKFFLLINVKMPNCLLLTFISRKNSILVLSEPEKC